MTPRRPYQLSRSCLYSMMDARQIRDHSISGGGLKICVCHIGVEIRAYDYPRAWSCVLDTALDSNLAFTYLLLGEYFI